MRRAKYLGFPDSRIAALVHEDVAAVRALREREDLHPAYRTVDICAGEFAANSPYCYHSYAWRTKWSRCKRA